MSDLKGSASYSLGEVGPRGEAGLTSPKSTAARPPSSVDSGTRIGRLRAESFAPPCPTAKKCLKTKKRHVEKKAHRLDERSSFPEAATLVRVTYRWRVAPKGWHWRRRAASVNSVATVQVTPATEPVSYVYVS